MAFVKTLRPAALAMCLIVTVCRTFAQPGGDFIDVQHPDGTALAALVSGTNCNAKAVVTRSPVVETAVWKRVELHAKGGEGAWEELFARTYGSPEFPMQPGVTITFRFASTKFPDETDITFRFRAWDANADLGGDPTKFIERTTKCYNRMEVMGTKNSVPPNLSRDIAKAAAFEFKSSHTMTPDVFSDPWRTKSELSNDLRHSTFTFFSTHGNLAVYEDSDGGAGHQITPSENTGFRFDNRPSATPGMNLAVMNACATLDSSSLPWPFSFGVHAFYSAAENKAYAGFDAVLPSGWEGPDEQEISLYNHACAFIESLKNGLTVSQAAVHVNSNYFAPGDLIVRGDGFARMINVYLNASERIGLTTQEINKWYRVF
jgi:hypothetical protein